MDGHDDGEAALNFVTVIALLYENGDISSRATKRRETWRREKGPNIIVMG